MANIPSPTSLVIRSSCNKKIGSTRFTGTLNFHTPVVQQENWKYSFLLYRGIPDEMQILISPDYVRMNYIL